MCNGIFFWVNAEDIYRIFVLQERASAGAEANVNVGDIGFGRPSAATNEGNINAVRLVIETDKTVTYRQIRTSLGIGMSQVHKILHEHLAILLVDQFKYYLSACIFVVPRHDVTSGGDVVGRPRRHDSRHGVRTEKRSRRSNLTPLI
ncbi:hypothetical protein EVAR_70131_1 [Eumeta japonica]|uniref:Histone-lysine N-methyltransferase SETMAR n=1 Tax=Eumeta variegata TaxID=151549 RepID=A0A4C1Z5D8_EUMVA|nr:hypothetical protein EVAR_70131_1 [Eumeta japonica]